MEPTGILLVAVLVGILPTTLSIDWCSLDTGYTTVFDASNYPRSVYVSLTRDGSVWMRMGPEHKSLDWMYDNEYSRKIIVQLLQHEDINILEQMEYSEYCVLTDLNLHVKTDSSWQPSYVVTYNPMSKETRILLFKFTRSCETTTNLTLTADKQSLRCNGGDINSCGIKNLPFKGQSTDSIFIKYVKFDPKGPDSFLCLPPANRNAFTFYGSYYHVYVKVASCLPPEDSRTLGFEAKLRPRRDTFSNFLYILDPTQSSINGGIIEGWRIFVKVMSMDHDIYLQVWRPSTHREEKYTLIGQTLFRPRHLRLHHVRLSLKEMIKTRKGDVLGIYFKKQNPIAWSMVPCSSMKQRFRYIHKPQGLHLGSQHSFKVAPFTWHPCRHYSLTALYKDKDDASLVEDWKCPSLNLDADPRKRSEASTRRIPVSTRKSTSGSKYVVMGSSGGAPKEPLPLYVILIISGIVILVLGLIVFVSCYCYFHRPKREQKRRSHQQQSLSRSYS